MTDIRSLIRTAEENVVLAAKQWWDAGEDDADVSIETACEHLNDSVQLLKYLEGYR